MLFLLDTLDPRWYRTFGKDADKNGRDGFQRWYRTLGKDTGKNGRDGFRSEREELSRKLKDLRLQTIETRRRRYDLIQTFQILKGFDSVDSSIWVETVGNEPSWQTRQSAYHLNLVRRPTRTDVRSNFFSNRVIEPWNRLPTKLKESRTVKSFKDGLDNII